MKRRQSHILEASPEADRPNKKLKTSDQSNFQDFLIDDIVKIIFSFLDETSRRHVRLVCTKWFNHINYSVFNIGAILPSEIEEVVRVFGRYNKQIALHFKQESPAFFGMNSSEPLLPTRDQSTIEPLSKLTNLVALSIPHFNDAFFVLTNLTALKSLNRIQCSTLQTFTKLKNLTIGFIDGDLSTNLPQLEELSITQSGTNGARLAEVAPKLKHVTLLNCAYETKLPRDNCTLPSLESLYVDKSWGSFGDLPALTRVTIEFDSLSFARHRVGHLTNLRHLNIGDNIKVANFPYLETLSLFCRKPKHVQQLTQLQHLTSLCLFYGTLSLSELHVLSKLTSVRNLELQPTWYNSNGAMDLAFISALTNLTSFKITLPRYVSGTDSLKYLTALKELEFESLGRIVDGFVDSLTNLTKLDLRLWQTPNYTHNLGNLTNLIELSLKTYNLDRTLSNNYSGFENLTQLTRLTFGSIVDDTHLNSISTLTKLKEYAEDAGFDTRTDRDRLSRLTAFKHLTKLVTGSILDINYDYITSLTKLQILKLFGVDNKLYSKLTLSLPFIAQQDNTPLSYLVETSNKY